MKTSKTLSAALAGFLLLVAAPATMLADDIKVAIAVSGGKRYISIVPKGGLDLAGAITGNETFILSNLSGAEIQGDSQVKIRFNDSVWARDGDKILRQPARSPRAAKMDLFELKGSGGMYHLQVPGGGWMGGQSEDKRSFKVVENEEDALQIEFIVNPQGQ